MCKVTTVITIFKTRWNLITPPSKKDTVFKRVSFYQFFLNCNKNQFMSTPQLPAPHTHTFDKTSICLILVDFYDLNKLRNTCRK